MSKRAERAAMEAYSPIIEHCSDGDFVWNKDVRDTFREGYERAEKDIKERLLELIEEEEKFWDDGEMIFRKLKKELNEI